MKELDVYVLRPILYNLQNCKNWTQLVENLSLKIILSI